jgi:hypothetical protein
MNRFQLWLLHFRLFWFGDKEYEKNGGGVIPCRECGRLFQSWEHFDYYDDVCEWCAFLRRNPMVVKKDIQSILLDYENGIKDWDETKAYLGATGIRIERPKRELVWGNCAEFRRESMEARK